MIRQNYYICSGIISCLYEAVVRSFPGFYHISIIRIYIDQHYTTNFATGIANTHMQKVTMNES